jgi:hypothetical protein
LSRLFARPPAQAASCPRQETILLTIGEESGCTYSSVVFNKLIKTSQNVFLRRFWPVLMSFPLFFDTAGEPLNKQGANP